MPYRQLWVDPNTGATYPQSFVVAASPPQVDFVNQMATLTARRYASDTCYSLGFKPIETTTVQIDGVSYGSIAPQLNAAQAGFQQSILAVADQYIGSVATFSGALSATLALANATLSQVGP